MFRLADSSFNQNLIIDQPIDPPYLLPHNVMYFDNDGFELTALEELYYRHQGVNVNDILNHNCDQQVWLTGGNDNFKIDHCLLLQRWKFDGAARRQLNQYKSTLPQLSKFLKIVPKWGIDFDLDYYKDDIAIEVLHIECDYRSYEEAMEAKQHIEQKILNTDWEDFVNGIIRCKSQWIDLSGFAQNDWKAVYWGLSRAEVTQKAYTGQ